MVKRNSGEMTRDFDVECEAAAGQVAGFGYWKQKCAMQDSLSKAWSDLLVGPKRVAESSKKGLGGGADSVWVASGIKRDVLFVVR